jgi:hypothetical protein
MGGCVCPQLCSVWHRTPVSGLCNESQLLTPNLSSRNLNTQSPMPEVVVVRSSSTTPSIVAHPSVFQSPMRILKRPSNSQSSSASSLSSATDSQSHQSLAEREARYQAARERIFGEERAGKGLEASGKEASRATTTVVRNLRGPSSSADGEEKAGSIAKGFESRRRDAGLRPTLEPPSK